MLRRILPLLCLLSVSFAPVASAAVSVSASVESGTYERVFSVVLTVSDPSAKLFYTFEPDGSPMDAYAYTGAIRVRQSTPLMYFAFTDPTNESPIYRQDYELRYPAHVALTVDPAARVASVFDYSARADSSVALDGWRVEKDGIILHEFGASEFARAGQAYTVSLVLPSDIALYGEYSLVAPDDTRVASYGAEEPAAPAPAPTVTYGPSYAAPAARPQAAVEVPAPMDIPAESAASASETPQTDTTESPVATDGTTDATASETETPTPAPDTALPASDTPEVSAEAPESAPATPDVTASARWFGGLLPLAFMFLVALAASAWRAMRVVAASPKKLR